MPIFHLDIEAFLTTVERLKNDAFRKRPLVIAPPKPRALVLAASPDAKALGITKDMPLAFAQKNFPGILVTPPNYKLYQKANGFVLDVVNQFSPIVEPIAFGHVAMDMTGMRALYGSLENAALKLCRELTQRASLTATVGIAANKLVSTIAAKEVQKANEALYQVPLDEEPRFLAPLACKALPEWQEKIVRKTLFELNLRRISQIQAIPRDLLSFALGRLGTDLHRHAMGIDPTPVLPPRNTPSLKQEHRFTPDTNDDQVIRSTLYKMTETLCFQLRARNMTASSAHLSLRYTDDITRERKVRFDPSWLEDPIYRQLLAFYQRLCDRRQRVRHLKLVLEGLNGYQSQGYLFQAPKTSKLAPHLDRLRTRFGAEAIHLGKSLARQSTVASQAALFS